VAIFFSGQLQQQQNNLHSSSIHHSGDFGRDNDFRLIRMQIQWERKETKEIIVFSFKN